MNVIMLSYVRQRALALRAGVIGRMESEVCQLDLAFGHFVGVKQLAEGRRRCGYSHQRASWKIFGLLTLKTGLP